MTTLRFASLLLLSCICVALASDAEFLPGGLDQMAQMSQNGHIYHPQDARWGIKGDNKLPYARFGVPTFEDEQCVLCQYVVQRVENELLKKIEFIDTKSMPKGAIPRGKVVSSTMDPFAPPAAPMPIDPAYAKTVSEGAGLPNAQGPMPGLHNSDLIFHPSLQYKKNKLKTLRTRWMGKSILRDVWSQFVTSFCSQGELPEMYVPVCGLFYKNAKVLMNAIFFAFPFDQVCLMGKMCGPKSYFSTPTAVHNPIMSMYYNNMRGPAGFSGGEHGRRDPIRP